MYADTLFGTSTAIDIFPRKHKYGRPLIIDSFAGGGGASTGIEMALGRSPDIAINHSAAALALHAANHPDTLHLSENIYKVDPLDHIAGEHVGLAWFSPDCKHFSKAKGGKPVERNIRDLAWVIVHWADRIQSSGGKIDGIIMENVEEFEYWGPLLETERGLMPDPDRKGETFQQWCKALRKLGGKIQKRLIRACDFGAPTIRKRLFVLIRFDGEKIVWPEPTHGAPDDRDVIAGRKLPYVWVADQIDWTIACPSIFDTSDVILAKHGLRSVRPLADNTMSRVARGMKRYVLDAERPFLVNLTHGARIEGIDQPLNTITGANRGEKALISPSVIRFNTGATGQDAREPLSTITANGFIKRPGGAAPLGIIAPHLMTMRNSGKPFTGADEPAHTITAGGAGLTIVAPVLHAAQHGGSMRSPCGPLHTVTASRKDQNSAAVAFLAQHNNDSRREGGVNPGRPVDAPISTITQSGSHQNVVTAFISRQFGESIGHAVDEPAHTITAGGGGKSAIVAPFLQAYYGTGDGGEEDRPCRTITTKDRHGHIEASVSAPPFTPEQEGRAREVAAFMRSYGFWDDREFVTLDVGGTLYVIVDIGMRMLTPRELFNAQGFPKGYIIDGAWAVPADKSDSGPVWLPFSKSVQVSCVGNSVSPPVACALVAANFMHLAELKVAA
jgi:DNA (cytosine-5)-methyltransferase 1